MDEEKRRQVDEELNQRDRNKLLKSGRIPKGVLEELYPEVEDPDQEMRFRKRIIGALNPIGDDDEEYKDTENYINREDVKGKPTEWLRQPHVIRYIQQTFSKFIKGYKDEQGSLVYEQIIIEMCTNNKQSLEVDYRHLYNYNTFLTSWILDHPAMILPHLNDVAFHLSCEIFPNYPNIHNEVFVRIKHSNVLENLRDLRHNHLNALVNIRGVVTKRTNVYPVLKKMMFYCTKCGEKKGPFYYNGTDDITLGSCLICQASGPYKLVESETLYRSYQKITIQESPGTVPPGRLPRQKEVILTDDLVDSTRPGDEVEITGTYISRFDISTNIRHCFPIFSTYIQANFIARLNELEATELTDEDKIEIRRLAKNPNITNLIFNSIAPSIYGNDFNKKALALAMFGGESKDIQNKHRIRGDINVLLLGDPGVAKSQFLKYVQKVFHRSVYTTGKGASAVGLTAGVHKDPVTKEWTLEGGALVLADKGICLIDEFDKMNDQDRTSIHEAMEQQSISISKAGIVTTLQARCSVIAAANPIKGRYDNQLTFSDNVHLTEPILSRFDILCVIKDEVDLRADTALSTFVINSHIMSHPEHENVEKNKISSLLPDQERENKELIPQDILKKYIMYARKYVHPKNSDLNKNKVSKFYAELRKESEKVGGMSIAVRHLESLLRIAESHAKMRLSDYVRADDMDFAIKIMLESFLMSQKASISKNLRRNFRNYLTLQEDHTQLLMNILNKLASQQVRIRKFIYFKLIFEFFSFHILNILTKLMLNPMK
jgi:DNA replication licensing factor MCM2